MAEKGTGVDLYYRVKPVWRCDRQCGGVADRKTATLRTEIRRPTLRRVNHRLQIQT